MFLVSNIAETIVYKGSEAFKNKIKMIIIMPEAQALLQAMESRVESVRLEVMEMDIRVLTKYNDHIKCWEVKCYNETATRYREQLRNWTTARGRKWSVKGDRRIYQEIPSPD